MNNNDPTVSGMASADRGDASASPQSTDDSRHENSQSDHAEDFVSIHHAVSTESRTSSSDSELSEAQLAQTISRRRSQASGHEGEEWAQIERLISRMFGHERKATSEDEKTRHVGVIWKNLTVKGLGLGAALQPTNGDIFLGLPRLIKRLLTRGRKGAGAGKPEIRTILNDFTVTIPQNLVRGVGVPANHGQGLCSSRTNVTRSRPPRLGLLDLSESYWESTKWV